MASLKEYHFNNIVPQLKEFVLVEKLGSGTYATVYRGYKKVVCLLLTNNINTDLL